MADISRIDCRGLSCPIPVIKTKKELEKKDTLIIEVTVDNFAAKENVSRLAKNMNYSLEIEDSVKGEWKITIKK